MKIEHEVIAAVVSHFLKNQPVATLTHTLFHKAKQVKEQHVIIKNVASMFIKEDECTIRIHWNDVCPRVLQDIVKPQNLTTRLELPIDGEVIKVMVDYEPNSMWFNIQSKTFDDIFEKAKERAKE